jgi:hypothetical protein
MLMTCCAYSCTQYSLHTHYILLTHADDLLCLQQHTVRSPYTVHSANACWWLTGWTQKTLHFLLPSFKFFVWLPLKVNNSCSFSDKVITTLVWHTFYSVSKNQAILNEWTNFDRRHVGQPTKRWNRPTAIKMEQAWNSVYTLLLLVTDIENDVTLIK